MTEQAAIEKDEICFIAPTDNLARRAREIIRKRELPIEVFTAALEDAVTVVEEQMKKGVWLFISRWGTRDLLLKRFDTTIVNIPLEASDYIPVIEQMRQEKGPVAFFSYEPLSDELKTICYLLHIDMRHYRFSDNQSCEACVKQAVQEGAVRGAGGIVSGRYAEESGLPYTIVESSEDAITQAIDTACQMYALQKENARKQEELQIRLERYQNILDYTHDAIIAVDVHGKIEVMNTVAEHLLDPGKKPYKGKQIEEVLPNTHMKTVLSTRMAETDQLMNIHGTLVSTNRVPIIVNRKVEGVVATFQDVKSLQSAERSIRIKLYEKGLMAKYHFSDILGESPAIRQAKALAQNFADAQFTVMLYGETGVGKELFAQSIHNASPRRDGPFVAVNCTALTKTLLESELFGYADSSFTGAKKGGKAGLFEMAHGGTLFLDEIGELPLEFQAQFLRVLQEKEVRRVGGDTVIPVDVRVIGATNRNLMALVENGSFRRDLYYRLDVLSLEIPPLRAREDDFLLIADSVYQGISETENVKERERFQRILKRFQGYQWLGNVRELTNMTERIYLLQRRGLSEEDIVQTVCAMMPKCGQAEQLLQTGSEETEQKKEITQEKKRQTGAFAAETGRMAEDGANAGRGALRRMELAYIREMLAGHQGNLSATAKALGMSRSTLYRKLQSEKQ